MLHEENLVTVRKAEKTDFTAIADLINTVFDEVEAECGPVDLETASLMGLDDRYFVAIDEGNRIVGCVMVNIKLRGIFQLAVEPSLRNRGIGRRLMEEAETHVRNLEWRSVRTGVREGRENLCPFYEKLGYIKMGTRKIAFPSDGFILIMSKTLFTS